MRPTRLEQSVLDCGNILQVMMLTLSTVYADCCDSYNTESGSPKMDEEGFYLEKCRSSKTLAFSADKPPKAISLRPQIILLKGAGISVLHNQAYGPCDPDSDFALLSC
jgi:hypothetical protein